jgi:hypothetical protein
MVRRVITSQLNSAPLLFEAPLRVHTLDFAEERCDIWNKMIGIFLPLCPEKSLELCGSRMTPPSLED